MNFSAEIAAGEETCREESAGEETAVPVQVASGLLEQSEMCKAARRARLACPQRDRLACWCHQAALTAVGTSTVCTRDTHVEVVEYVEVVEGLDELRHDDTKPSRMLLSSASHCLEQTRGIDASLRSGDLSFS